jgi:hypothetical protein
VKCICIHYDWKFFRREVEGQEVPRLNLADHIVQGSTCVFTTILYLLLRPECLRPFLQAPPMKDVSLEEFEIAALDRLEGD